jgi:hypothetical protein
MPVPGVAHVGALMRELDESALPTAYNIPFPHATTIVPSELMTGEAYIVGQRDKVHFCDTVSGGVGVGEGGVAA